MFDVIFNEVKKITVTLLVCDVVITALALIGGFFGSDIVLGMVYGFIFAELMFILLGSVCAKVTEMDEKRAKRHMKVNFYARYALTFVILLIPFLSDGINPWCVVVAMLSPKLTYFAIGFYDMLISIKRR